MSKATVIVGGREMAYGPSETRGDLDELLANPTEELKEAMGRLVTGAPPKPPVEAKSQPAFDYKLIDEAHRDSVQAAAISIQQLSAGVVTGIHAIGKRLLEVKHMIPHGQFVAWVEGEFGMEERAAQRYMNVAREYDDPQKRQTLSLFSPSIAYLLAAPSTPEEARAEVEQAAANGQKVTVEFAKEAIRKARPEPVNYAPVWALESAVREWLKSSIGDATPDAVVDALKLQSADPNMRGGWLTPLCQSLTEAEIAWRKSDLSQAIINVRDQRRQAKLQASSKAVYVEPEPEPEPVEPTPDQAQWPNGPLRDVQARAEAAMEQSAPAVAEPVTNEIETLLMPHEVLRAAGFVIQRKRGERGVFVFRWSLRDGRFGEWLPLLQEAADQGLRWYGASNPQPPTESDRHQNSVELLTSPTIDITTTLPMSLHWAIKQATVEDLQVALATLPPQLVKGRGPVLQAALKNRGVTVPEIVPPLPDPRLALAQEGIAKINDARIWVRDHYQELTGRDHDPIGFWRDTAAMLESLESLVDVLEGEAHA